MKYLTEEQWQALLRKRGRPRASRDPGHVVASERPTKEERTKHIVRWWNEGMSVEEMMFAMGYKRTTIEETLAKAGLL